MIQKQTEKKSQYGSVNRSIRFTFSYRGADIKLESRQSIRMISPPSDIFPVSGKRSGFWYELRDKENRVLYRRIIQNPVKYTVEVRSDEKETPLVWEKVKDPAGQFVLLVPELPEIESIVLVSSPFEPDRANEEAVEITKFPVSEK